ncbi:MAG: hypothetical protein ACKVXR_15650 [Planctomycetota bacterium]
MFSMGVLIDAIALVLGILWCRAMFKRCRSDFDELLEAANVRKCMTISALWGVTCVVLCIVVGTSIGIVRGISAGL